MTKIICVLCPKGCHLHVDERNNYAVTGNQCSRGIGYGKSELENPVRMVTSTVAVVGAIHRRCPVKTAAPVPKGLMKEAMGLLKNVTLTAPVEEGQVVVADICGTGVAFVATRDM
ncbi:MAG: DUF1667 domain-containing protein [Defluviitaleaceae bacterium]|nr:DUF1667 domain-containing protein [Defluviitaleaceae bacterium]